LGACLAKAEFNAAAGAPSSGRDDFDVFGTAGGVLRGLEALLCEPSSLDVSPAESDVVEADEVVAEGAAVANVVVGVDVKVAEVVAAGRAMAAAAAFSFSSSAFTAFNKNSICD